MKLGERDARRLLERMGLKLEPLQGVEEVVIRTGEREIVVKGPAVSQIRSEQLTVFQVAGGTVEERAREKEARPLFTQEDVELVALQARVSKEEAARALQEAGGDLAKAILSLSSR